MSKVFIYEHLSAAYSPRSAPASLSAEGRAMLEAVLQDLARASDVSLVTLLHQDQPADSLANCQVIRNIALSHADPVETFFGAVESASKSADMALVIAPESDGVLETLIRFVGDSGTRILGPSADSVHLWSDKQLSAERLGDSTTPTCAWPRLPIAADDYVVKPRDGAGCLHTWIVDGSHVGAVGESIRSAGYAGDLIVQPFMAGDAVSAAIFADGRGGGVVLPAVRQLIESSMQSDMAGKCLQLSYSGGAMPIARELDQRAARLARRVLDADPALVGYVGVDMVLGPEEDGSLDRIIEVNPRLTTSYVGYRQFLRANLGSWLLDPTAAKGPLRVRPGASVRFFPDGKFHQSHDEAIAQ